MRRLPAALLAPAVAAAVAAASGPVVDGHNHDALSATGGVLDTSRVEVLRERDIQAAVVVLPVDRSPTADLAARIEHEVEELRRAAGAASGFTLAECPSRLLAGAPDGEVRLLLSMEWFGEIIAGDLGRIRRFRDLGVRVIGLAEQGGDSLFEDDSSMLTPFGSRVIAAMNDAGVLIDITHLSHPQKLAVIAASRDPVAATHALVQSVSPVPFNLPDEVVDALAARGGTVWVSFNRSDLLGDGEHGEDGALDTLVDHIDALVARLGPGRVGIGSDLQAGGRYVPGELNRRDSFARIRRALAQRGYTPAQIDGIMGGNVLRALADAD